MEACGANFFDEDWESLSKLFSIEENNDNFDFQANVLADSCFHERSQESSNGDENQETSLFLLDQQNQYGHCLNLLHQDNINTFEPSSMDLLHINNLNTPVFSDNHVGVMEELLGLNPESWPGNNDQLGLMQSAQDSHELKRKFAEDDDRITNLPLEGQSENNSSEGPRKKARPSRNNKNKRATQPRKNKRVMQEKDISEEEIITSNNNANKQSSSSCSNIDQEDSNNNIPNNNSQEISNSASLNSNGKARATRGSATDPQSLYARRRRERINERLKILQGLVPNGTKVDISTMLEEAVHYVKFLQLQIKLLSSDELWMYAPIAYNGIMDVGMYQKICPNLWP